MPQKLIFFWVKIIPVIISLFSIFTSNKSHSCINHTNSRLLHLTVLRISHAFLFDSRLSRILQPRIPLNPINGSYYAGITSTDSVTVIELINPYCLFTNLNRSLASFNISEITHPLSWSLWSIDHNLLSVLQLKSKGDWAYDWGYGNILHTVKFDGSFLSLETVWKNRGSSGSIKKGKSNFSIIRRM